MKAQDYAQSITELESNRTASGFSNAKISRRFPIGAEVRPTGGVDFRVWAPKREAVVVQFEPVNKLPGDSSKLIELKCEKNGYFSGHAPEAKAGMLYKFQLGSETFPDPASRFQPEGPHGFSQIMDPSLFAWTDQSWPGVSRHGAVIYEMHIGTFTREGTWAAAAEELQELARLGITVLEIMPVADFPGQFGWGYDGVNLFAPTRLYGVPDDFRAFVNRAHNLGMGVILDVVYNHFGPDGNYLNAFSDDYGTNRYQNEWGQAINFDGENSAPVREFFVTNAAYWIDEFHLDGLRLDATQQIFDASAENIITIITRKVREAAKGRGTYLVGENEPQEANLVRPPGAGGYGMDALWNDDFHHSAVAALTGRNEAYYCDYRGTPQEFISATKWGFLYQGQWYCWQKKRRGKPAFGLEPSQFITFLQNHDQIANSLRGLRAAQLSGPGRLKALTALLLLGPATPMLFQGQEFAASSPFLYFADHQPDLAQLVCQGRKQFLKQFSTIACAEADAFVADPGSEETFLRSKLDFSERQKHAEMYALHRDLLRLRREDPAFSQPRVGGMDGAVLGPDAFVLRFFEKHGQDRLLFINLGLDLNLSPAPEPLLAPVEGCEWSVKWSSEAPCYGGCGTPPLETAGNWRILGHAAVVLAPKAVAPKEESRIRGRP